MKRTKKTSTAPRRGNLLDLLLLFLIVLSVFGILWRQYEATNDEHPSQAIQARISAVAFEVDAGTCQSLWVGAPLYTASGEYFGQIAGVEMRPAIVTMLSGGVFYEVEQDMQSLCELHLEIDALAILTDRGVLINRYRGAVGRELPILYTENACLELVLYRINSQNR